MVITRKIEIFVCEEDKELRKEYYKKLYDNRDIAVKVANMCASHMFMLDHSLPYLNQEDYENLTFLGVKGDKSTRKNAPYVAASEAFKGVADMGMVSCVIQNVRKVYQHDRKQGMWNRSLRSYKSNMPVPYGPDRFINLRFVKCVNQNGKEYDGCFFTLMGVPFQMRFGRDRSGNKVCIQRILEQQKFDLTAGKEGSPTGYKMSTSSIAFDKKFNPSKNKDENKIFLYLCVDIPPQTPKVNPKKVLFAYLGLAHPIQCYVNSKCDDILSNEAEWISIGTAEEFTYRRAQIQAAIRRCQINCKYSKGGKGRKRKLQALERFHDKEKNYIDTKLHCYSRELVNLAVSHGCGTVFLVNQKEREDKAKSDNKKGKPTVLRNWSYFGLKEKISYKCKMAGIKLQDPGEKKNKDKDNE